MDTHQEEATHKDQDGFITDLQKNQRQATTCSRATEANNSKCSGIKGFSTISKQFQLASPE